MGDIRCGIAHQRITQCWLEINHDDECKDRFDQVLPPEQQRTDEELRASHLMAGGNA
jgi:hypothetical protein